MHSTETLSIQSSEDLNLGLETCVRLLIWTGLESQACCLVVVHSCHSGFERWANSAGQVSGIAASANSSYDRVPLTVMMSPHDSSCLMPDALAHAEG